ncbi:MAG TPA: TetR/AcrR family transcriptional regulator [Burkholderiaceae bacterium]
MHPKPAAEATPRLTRGEATRERILEVASRALRREGFAGVGVADVMREAGLTHGGFYAHFESREALLAAAIERAGHDTNAAMCRHIEASRARGRSGFRAVVDAYLSPVLLTRTEVGCVVAAVGSEMARQPPELLALSAERVRRLVALIEQVLPQDADRSRAPMIAGTLVGTLQLARTLGANAQGKAMLAAARDALLAQYDPPQ